MCSLIVASDIGGTFTDTVTVDEAGRVRRYKSPTVPSDPALGVVATLELAAADLSTDLDGVVGRIGLFAHGTTVATNALLEGKGAKVGLLQTRGFGDTLSVMRGFKSLGLDEEHVKDFRHLVKQEPVVSKDLIAEVTERVDYRGRVVMDLDESDARAAVERLVEAGAEVFAVSLLWSFRNDAHEKRVAEIIEKVSPGALVTLSSELLPRLGEYARSATTAINAGLRPKVREAVGNLRGKLSGHGFKKEPLLMQSSGGLAPVEEIDREAASTVMSGPVGGVVACQALGALRGQQNIITTDMGGTSFDAGLIVDGQPLMSNITQVTREPISLPSVAVRTVGAGSGSIASVENGFLRVGPRSAGAEPGPACYGRGGNLPTVTDADVVLGYINPDNFLGGRLKLDADLACEAVDLHVAGPLGMSVEEAAEGIKTIVDHRMADLLREMTVERGFDPRDFTTFAYGGAGPTHAFSYGAELGTAEIVIPATASVHSAYGIASSDLTAVEEVSEPFQSPPGETDHAKSLPSGRISEVFSELQERASERLVKAGVSAKEISVARSVEMRFRQQIHVLTIPVEEFPLDDAGVNRLVGRFIDLYEARFGEGSAFEAAGVELTTFRLVARAPTSRTELSTPEKSEPSGAARSVRRKVFRRGEWEEAGVLGPEALFPGAEIEGLAIVELADTTIVVGADQRAVVDEFGNVVIKLGD